MEVMVYVVCVVTLFETEVVLYVLSNHLGVSTLFFPGLLRKMRGLK